jgi:hypothetical protein
MVIVIPPGTTARDGGSAASKQGTCATCRNSETKDSLNNPFVVGLSNHEHINVSVATATVELNVGSRTHGRDTFLCLSKEK